uniref:Shugoshin C-terminal domain-containing protein n=1 Tax=Peronospora matthiolae TaxID=2874970 RepID=A0AAV1T8P3_9STRA
MSSTTPPFLPATRQERNQDPYHAYDSDNHLLRAVSRASLSIKKNELDRSSNNVANSCDVAKSWNVANSCDVAKSWNVANSCDVAKSWNVANSCDVAKSWNVANSWNANSHFHRRSQLEARLVELQKDVASLTLQLRFSGNSRPLLGGSSVKRTSQKPDDELESLKWSQKPSTIKSRRKCGKEQLLEANKCGGSRVKTVKELYDVTIERDQLKLELVRTKKALAAARKKSEDVKKNEKAYDELTVHCESLQKSLELSERIRVRQKTLLQQLQSQQRQKTTKEESENTRNKVAGVKIKTKSAGVSADRRSTNTGSQQAQDDSSARRRSRMDCGNSDFLIAPGQPNEEEHDDDQNTSEQAASEPTAAADTRPQAPRPVLEFTTPKGELSQDADSQRPGQIAANTTRQPSRAQARQLEVRRQTARWARSRGATVQIPTVNTQMTPKQRAAKVVRPKNGYLAPTQASLRRLHDLPRREIHYRPPFVV